MSEPQPAGRQAPQRLQALVRGRVQAVGFRQFVWSRAARLGVNGWVRNGNDGRSVEVEAEGPADALEALRDVENTLGTVLRIAGRERDAYYVAGADCGAGVT